MNSNNPYSPRFIENQKQKLVEDKSRIEQELLKVATYDEEENKYIPKFEEYHPGEGEDEAEAADEITTYDENTALANDLVKLLEENKAALKKIDTGQYGYCQNCGEYISEDRLKAYPAASICIKCEG